MTARRLVIPLRQAGDAPLNLVGGKARELGELLSHGFRVPDGMVITTEATHAVSMDAPPDEVRAVLDIPRTRAFRSSAVGEDGERSSFAGQFESVLGVRDYESAVAALQRCWQSARSPTVAAYVRAVSHGEGAMAVIVQDMVDAQCAGVAFTANPVTGADEVLVEATTGLGDALLDGRVDPERWRVPGDGRAERLSGPEVLTVDQVDEVRRLCLSIAEARGRPQDVEWAYDRSGELFVLQSRPITALPIEPTARPPARQCWVRDDAHFPEPVLPLAASTWLPIHRASIAHVAETAGLPFRSVHTEVFGGRVYARIEPLVDAGRDDEAPPPAWVLALVMRVVPAFRRRFAAARRALVDDLPMRLIEAWEASGRMIQRQRLEELLGVEVEGLDDAELGAHLDACLGHLRQVADDHFELAAISGWATLGELGRLLHRELGWSVAQTLDLVQGFGAASTAAGRAIDELADALRDDGRAAELLRANPGELAAWEGPGGQAWRAFLRERGRRTFSAAIDRPTWHEDPTPLVALVTARLDGGVRRSDPHAAAMAAEERLFAEIPADASRAKVARALERARRARPYQDETEDGCFEAMAPIRFVALEAGRRFEARGILRAADDVWFLELEELRQTLRGHESTPDILRRRAEVIWARGNRLPARLGPEPPPMPDLRFPRGVDAFLGGIMWTLAADETPADPHRPPTDADLHGIGCSPGQVEGRVRKVNSVDELHTVRFGDILVCPGTTAAWSFAFCLVAGLVTQTGGPLSHPATLAREYGIPGVLGVPDAMAVLQDGERVRIDGTTGAVWRIDRGEPD